MTLDPFSLGWLVFGVLLMLLELAVPGLVVVFFGAAALLVGLGAGLGLIETWGLALLVWVFCSTGLVLGARGGMRRLSPGAEERVSTDEELEAFGERVLVVEAMAPNVTGRIRFRGSTWPARTVEERLEPGASARIVTRDNLVWIVEEDSEPPLISSASAGG